MKLSQAFQYISITLGILLNLSFFTYNFDQSALFPTIITFTDLLLFPISRHFSSSVLFIHQRGMVFYSIPIDNSIFR